MAKEIVKGNSLKPDYSKNNSGNSFSNSSNNHNINFIYFVNNHIYDNEDNISLTDDEDVDSLSINSKTKITNKLQEAKDILNLELVNLSSIGFEEIEDITSISNRINGAKSLMKMATKVLNKQIEHIENSKRSVKKTV